MPWRTPAKEPLRLLPATALGLTLVLIALMALMPVPSSAQNDPVTELFSPYAQLLDAHLKEKDLPDNGLVSAFDYQAALNDPQTGELLEQQRQALARFEPAGLDNRASALAFWNNAYNFFILEQILRDRPNDQLVASVWDYGGRFNPFRDSVFERKLFTIGGNHYSLDQMEKDILLGDEYAQQGWKDARVHFTVNCASVGCPPLRQQIYQPDNMDALLAENTRRALNSRRHLYLEGSTLYLSSLFDWYKHDYVDQAGSVEAFLRQHGGERIANKVDQAQRIRYINYDWSLNSPENTPEM